LIGYSVVLVVLAVILGVMLLNRSDAEATLLRAPGSLFQQMPDGRYSNLYTVRLINKTNRDLPVDLRLQSPAGMLTVMGSGLILVPAQKLSESSVLIELDPQAMLSGTTPVVVGAYVNDKKIQTLKTAFIGPRN